MPEFTSYIEGTPSWAEPSTSDDQGALFGWVDEANEIGPGMYYHMQMLNGLEVAALYQQSEEKSNSEFRPIGR